jgi:hypothetical protein
MAASGFTPIQLYYSTTSGAAPVAGNLLNGELAINIREGKLYYKDASGIVQLLAGLSGYSGLSGASGYSGFSGYSGATGTSGFSGYSGSTGSTGTSGYSGATGTSGFSGYSGTGGTGSSGYSGYSGETGASGISGYSGVNGVSGFSGYSGSVGTSGFSGYSGATGPTTYPGAGIALSTGSAWGTSFNNSSNPVSITYGGTGQTSFTAGQVHYGSFSTSANLFWDNGNTRLGVGTNVPVTTLYVRGGNSNNLAIDNAGQQFTTFGFYNNGSSKAQIYYDNTNSLFVTGTDTASSYLFKTAGSEKARISSAGGFSVGTASDAGAGNILVNGAYKTLNFSIIEESGVLNFYNGATKIASMDSSGNLTTLGNQTAAGTP